MNKLRENRTYLISLIASIAVALLIGGVLIAITGHNPIEGYGALINGVFGNSRVLGNTIAKALQLCLTALAMAVAAKAGMFNVGGEGQLYLGGLAATMVGVWLTGLPAILVIPLVFLSGMAAGGLFALIPAWLKVKLHVSEVITTIMLNSAAIFFCKYLVNGPLRSTEKGVLSATNNIYMYEFTDMIRGSNLSTALIYGVVIAFLIWYVMEQTTIGLEMKLTGENERFAFFSGLKKDKVMIWAMVASGAICGIVGIFEVYGIQGRFNENISNEFYYDGMLVAMIMNYNPIGIIIMSFFFAILKIGAFAMELSTGIPGEISQIMFAIIIFLMAAQNGIVKSIAQKYIKNKAKHQSRKSAEKELNDGTINADI